MAIAGIILPRMRLGLVRRRNGKYVRLDTGEYMGHFDKCLENTGHVIRYKGQVFRSVRRAGSYWTHENQPITEGHILYKFLTAKDKQHGNC